MNSQPTKKDIVLDAAQELITQKGVASTTLSDIARESGLAKGTIHYHFPSKHEILIALADRQVKEYTKRLLTLSEKKCTSEHKREILLSIIRELTAPGKGKLIIHLIMEGNSGNDELKSKFLEKYEDWRKTLEQGLMNQFTDIGEDSAHLILATLIGFLFHNVIGAPPPPPKKVLSFILKGITSQTNQEQTLY